MSETTYEPLVTDFEGIKSLQFTEENQHRRFQFPNGYTLSVLRTDGLDGLGQRVNDFVPEETPIGKFEAVLMITSPRIYQAIGIWGEPVSNADLFPLEENTMIGNLSNADVNQLLEKVSLLPMATELDSK